jgi:O-antigen/teichoic acid export membrane protein
VIRARQLAGAGIGLGAVTIWGALLGLVTTPYLIHRLGVSAYGVFALITILAAYLLNLEFGFGHATIRFLARARARGVPGEEAEVIGTSLAVFLPAAIVGGSLALFGASFIARHFAHGPVALHGTFVDAIRLGGLIISFSFVTAFASSSLQALGQFNSVVRTRAVFGTLASVAAVSVAAGGGGLRGVLAAQVGVSGGMCATLLRAVAKATDAPLRPRLHSPTFRAMAGYGIFILMSGLATQTMIQGPPAVLAGYSTTAEVAAFAVPNLVLQQLVGLISASSLGFLPYVSAASADSDRTQVSAVYRANLRMTLLIMGPIAIYLAIFARTLLATWIDPSFAAQAQVPLRLLAAAIVMLALSAPPADVARGFGRPALVTIYTALTAAATVGLALAAVPAHGAAGAAFALAAGLTLTTLPFMFVIAIRLLGLRPAALLDSLYAPVLALLGVAAIFGAVALGSGSFTITLAAGLVGTVAYATVVFRFVLDERERGVFTSLWKRFAEALRRPRSRAQRSVVGRAEQ